MSISQRSLLLAVIVAGVVLVVSVQAKKQLETFAVIKPLKPHLACPICRKLVHQGVEGMKDLKKSGGGKITEDDVLSEVVETVCNPRHAGGHWMRKLDVVVETDAKTSKPSMVLQEREEAGKCRRECTTLADVCNGLLDGEDFDDFSSMLFRKKSEDHIAQRLCTPLCSPKYLKKEKAMSITAKEMDVEPHEPIESKELEVESMMDNMDRQRKPGTPGYDVFSRDEMYGLKDAMRDGDYERFKELDPTADQLSEEEFMALRQMQAAEDGGVPLPEGNDAGDGAGTGEEYDEPEYGDGHHPSQSHRKESGGGGRSWWDAIKGVVGL